LSLVSNDLKESVKIHYFSDFHRIEGLKLIQEAVGHFQTFVSLQKI